MAYTFAKASAHRSSTDYALELVSQLVLTTKHTKNTKEKGPDGRI